MDVVAAARALVGTPYHHQGRKAGVGLDCIGVPILAARTAGAAVHDFAAYGPMPVPEILLREIAMDCEQVTIEQAKPGDVLCFKSGMTHPSHFGIMLDDGGFVHAYERMACVVREPLDGRWLRLLHSVWRIRGID